MKTYRCQVPYRLRLQHEQQKWEGRETLDEMWLFIDLIFIVGAGNGSGNKKNKYAARALIQTISEPVYVAPRCCVITNNTSEENTSRGVNQPKEQAGK
ncbi:hypothetical protein NDU88_003326 [Pleurodeles waltl]|uniref:Uncharacterized protein n=1 Tax=Pleurodeles waltl TaxID=8319 RepID=A0AAV7VDP7_PLEWA|nr:hypothetical protein NDU88_003326 [Pleurodeles waltl]